MKALVYQGNNVIRLENIAEPDIENSNNAPSAAIGSYQGLRDR